MEGEADGPELLHVGQGRPGLRGSRSCVVTGTTASLSQKAESTGQHCCGLEAAPAQGLPACPLPLAQVCVAKGT